MHECRIKNMTRIYILKLIKLLGLPWPGRSVGCRVIPIYQSCGFDPWSWHIQEANNEWINK